MLANLIPTLIDWAAQPSALAFALAPGPAGLRITLTLFAIGVFASGIRDLYAALGLPGGSWPWKPIEPATARDSA